MATAAQKAIAEQWLGTVDSTLEGELDTLLTTYSCVHIAVLARLLRRYSDLLGDPLNLRVEGDAAWNNEKNAERIQAQVNALAAVARIECGTAGTLNDASLQVLASADAVGTTAQVVTPQPYKVVNTRPFSSKSRSRHTRYGHGLG